MKRIVALRRVEGRWWLRRSHGYGGRCKAEIQERAQGLGDRDRFLFPIPTASACLDRVVIEKKRRGGGDAEDTEAPILVGHHLEV